MVGGPAKDGTLGFFGWGSEVCTGLALRRESSEGGVLLEGCIWLTLSFMSPILAYSGPRMAHSLILEARRQFDLVVREVN